MRFELIKGTSTLQGTCYFEFCKDSKKQKTCWNEDALYLEDEVFNFFHSAFSKSSREYDYYDFCKFEAKELEKLKSELIRFEGSLNSLQSLTDFEAFFGKIASFIEPNQEHDELWSTRTKSLGKIAGQFQNLVCECLLEKETLWVLGM
jgi:hypothetical protein